MNALLRTAAHTAVVRQVWGSPRKGKGKRKGGPTPQQTARWVMDHVHQVAGTLAFLYLWAATGNLLQAVLLTVVFTVGVFGAWLGYKQKRTGMTVQASLAELQRRRRLNRQWPKALEAIGVKRPLRLRKITGDDKGDLTAIVHAGPNGVPPETLMKATTTLAPVIGCREVQVRAMGYSGTVELRFLWSDPLAKIVRPRDITSAPHGVAPTSLDDQGRVVGLPVLNKDGETIFLPTLVGGVSGSGKSGWLWAFLAGCVAQGIPVRLRVLDPAGGTELAALAEALDPNGTGILRVHRYDNKPSGATKMVKEQSEAMNARLRSMSGTTRLHKPTLAEPLDLLIVDEFLRLPDALKKGDGDLAEILSIGRKAGFSAIALTQIGHADALGRVRDLFPRRLCFGTRTVEQTVAVLGSRDLADMAPAHRIPESTPGVYYGVSDTERGMRKGRCMFLDDRATREVAKGHLPIGMETFGQTKAQPTGEDVPHAVYRLFDAERTLLYVGITDDLKRRWRQHSKDQPWWNEVDVSLSRVVWASSEKEARTWETKAIEAELPKFNTQGNTRNPLRRVRLRATA